MSWRNIYLDNHVYFFTSSVVEHLPVLRNKNAEAIIELLTFYRQHYEVKIHAYVILPHHIHLLLSSPVGGNIKNFMQHMLKNSSKRIVQNFQGLLADTQKSKTARQFLRVFQAHANGKANYAVWKEKARGVAVYTEKIFRIKLDYIHNNPVRAGYVNDPADYLYSSYRNYYLNDNSVMEIDALMA